MLHMLKEGGPIVLLYMIPLFCYSILSVAVMLERIYTLRKLRRLEAEEFPRIQESLMAGKHQEVKGMLQNSAAPIAPVLLAGMEANRFGADQIKESFNAALSLQNLRFGRYLSVLATVGSTSPFIGLFGTVLGILRAFNKIAQQGFGGPSVVAGGIAEALTATAIGLGIAIPAVIAYNYFVARVNDLSLTVGAHATALLPFITEPELMDATL
ncbi:MAG TPA: MotA/TolQ/ExbB proton channel family protein [Armatimonadota bacterium]|nr:MotA/TolQ/ExbB proton channel family protein [Armatimonadota bacterium]